MLNPITVQAIKMEDGTEKYNLVDGERRYRAIMLLIEKGEKIKDKEIDYVSAIKVPSNLSKSELYVQQAMRNEGKNFNEFEWAVLASKLRDECGITNMSEIARMLGKNNGQVVYWRRVLQAHGRDTDKAWEDIEKMQAAAEEKGEENLSLKDLGYDSKTKIFKDSKTIYKGIKVLFDYVEHYSQEGVQVEMDLSDMFDRLKNGELIDNILKGAVDAENEKVLETA